MVYVCKVCSYKYDESREGTPFANLPEMWVCPVCGVPKSMFEPLAEEKPEEEVVKDAQKKTTVGDVIARTLSDCGVKWIFGMVGHSNLGIADGIRRNENLKFLSIRHEGAAAFACSAYGKLMGRPAACLTIAGPGATNLMTGLYDAKLDSSPALAITGQVPSADIGANIFQEIDFDTLFADVAISRQMIFDAKKAESATRLACRRAVEASGVAQISVPDDVQTQESTYEACAEKFATFNNAFVPSSAKISEAAKFIRKYKNPLVVIGAGCAGAMNEVLQFVELLKCPTMTTYRAKGFLPDAHPYACGVVGRSGTAVSATMLLKSDCVIALGARLSRHTSIPNDKAVLQIDIRREEIGRLHKVDFGIVGDVKATLVALSTELKDVEFSDTRAEIAQEWNQWRAEKAKRASESKVNAIAPADVFVELSKCISKDAIVSVDVGDVAYSLGRYFEAQNQRFLLSFYLGSIGVGLPSAMGAWCATQEKGGEFFGRKVVAVVGDGGLGQYLADWTSVVSNGMDIKCVVLNNGELAKISREQRAAKFPVWETALINPNFSEFAKSCGAKGVRISDPEKLAEQLSEALNSAGATLIEIMTNPNLG